MKRILNNFVFLSFVALSLLVSPLSLHTCHAEKNALVALQKYNDMMYGSDDYFGESRDLLYTDYVIPTDRKKSEPTIPKRITPAESTTNTTSDNDDDDSGDDTDKSVDDPDEPVDPVDPDDPVDPVDPDDPDIPDTPEPPEPPDPPGA